MRDSHNVRPCLHCRQPVPTGKRCRCRSNATTRGYNAQHQRDREQLLATQPACHWCGDWPATTADHVPPLRTAPTPAEWDGIYVPACEGCQNAHIPDRDNH